MKITQQQLRQIIKEEAEAHFAEMHGRGGKHHGMSAGHSNRMRLDRLPALGEPDPEFDADFYMDSQYDIDETADEADEMYDVDLDEGSEEEEEGALHEEEEEDEGAVHEGEEEEEEATAEGLNESRWGKLAGLKG